VLVEVVVDVHFQAVQVVEAVVGDLAIKIVTQ
jgi:hypothetical protein